LLEKTIICLGSGYSQIPLIKIAKKMGMKVIVIDQDANSPGFKLSNLQINESLEDIDKVIFELKKFQSKYKFVGVVARTTGKSLYLAAKISSVFKLSGITNDLIDISIKKSTLRDFCKKNKIPFPKGIRVKNQKELKTISYPIIVKPDYSIKGKFGISKCKNSNELKKYFEHHIPSQNNQFEVQSYVDGIDCGCICWANYGKSKILTWLDELVGIDNHDKIIGIGVNIPSVIKKTKILSKIEKIVEIIVKKFPQVNSILLISFRISFDGIPYLIEIHADLGGDLIAEKLLPLANSNFDFFKFAINVSLNKKRIKYKVHFKFTSMYYNTKSTIIPNKKYSKPTITNKNILHNLQTMNKIIKKRNLKLTVIPKHEQWYKQNV
jgi:hypothetical protein